MLKDPPPQFHFVEPFFGGVPLFLYKIWAPDP